MLQLSRGGSQGQFVRCFPLSLLLNLLGCLRLVSTEVGMSVQSLGQSRPDLKSLNVSEVDKWGGEICKVLEKLFKI